MKNFKYKTIFASKVRCLIDEEKDKILAKASLDNLKSIIPESVKNQPTLLAIAFNSCVPNLGNLNGAVIDTKTALAIYKDFIHLPINAEHSRTASYGHIVNASFSEFDINYATGSGSKILDTANLKDTNEPFNLALAGVIYRLYAPELCEAIEDSNDPNSLKYLEISASWELLYDEFDLAVGSKYLKECEIITDEKKKEEYASCLMQNGGNGKLLDGRPVYVLLKNEVIAGGIGLTFNPAGDVKGVITDSEKAKISIKSNKDEETHASSEHYIEKCSCGEKIGGCRCSDDNKKIVIVQNGCEKCKKPENSNSQLNISNVNDTKDNIKSNKIMDLKSRKDITDEALKEVKANQILTVLDTEIEKISKDFEEKRGKVENELKASSEKLTEAEKKINEQEVELNKIKEDLQKIVKANQDREQEEIFNTRMGYFDAEYDLSEEKIRNIVAKKIKTANTEEEYSEAKEEIELLLAAKKKSGKVFDKESKKWVDPKEDKEEKKDSKETKASVENKEEVKTDVVDTAIDNGEKAKAAVAATTTPTEDPKQKWNDAFGETAWEINKRGVRR